MTDLIYIIDDEPGLAELMSEALTIKLERNCKGFSSADLARVALAKEAPSLLIIDHNLAGQCGLELATEIRQSGHNCPIIFITGEIESSFQDDEYRLKKPFSVKDLAKLILEIEKKKSDFQKGA